MWDPSSPTRDQTHLPYIGMGRLNHWTIREVPASFIISSNTRWRVRTRWICQSIQGSQEPTGHRKQAWMEACCGWRRGGREVKGPGTFPSLSPALTGHLSGRLRSWAAVCREPFRLRLREEIPNKGPAESHP